jgi:hypothetical protein
MDGDGLDAVDKDVPGKLIYWHPLRRNQNIKNDTDLVSIFSMDLNVFTILPLSIPQPPRDA